MVNFLGEFFVNEGADLCAKLGAKLPLPKSSTDTTTLKSIVENEFSLTNKNILLDGSDRNTEQTWKDSLGRQVTFTNWATNEPNNELGDVYMVGVQPDMKFDDKNADHKTQVICQKNFDNGQSK